LSVTSKREGKRPGTKRFATIAGKKWLRSDLGSRESS